MKSSTVERLQTAAKELEKGSRVWIRLEGDVTDRRVFKLEKTRHNLRAAFDTTGQRWTIFEPDELVGVLIAPAENTDAG